MTCSLVAVLGDFAICRTVWLSQERISDTNEIAFASAPPRWLCEVGDFTFVASLYRLDFESGKLNTTPLKGGSGLMSNRARD